MTDAATGPGIAAVILAAGAGQRLGGVAKALLPHPAGSYLAAIAATAREVGLVDAVVVVGAPFGDEVAAHARQLGLRVRVNPAPERGMASSVALVPTRRATKRGCGRSIIPTCPHTRCRR
jgi:CTP:molybdopterin cytidylyltransferase MocA